MQTIITITINQSKADKQVQVDTNVSVPTPPMKELSYHDQSFLARLLDGNIDDNSIEVDGEHYHVDETNFERGTVNLVTIMDATPVYTVDISGLAEVPFIGTRGDAVIFFTKLCELNLNWHPDDSGSDYVRTSDGNPFFSPLEVQEFDILMNQAYHTLGQEEFYALALEVVNNYENGVKRAVHNFNPMVSGHGVTKR